MEARQLGAEQQPAEQSTSPAYAEVFFQMSKSEGTHSVYWSLIFRVGNRDKAMKELRRAEALFGRSLRVASFEPYWKTDGQWRCEASAQLPATSAAELVTNALLLADRLAKWWHVHGPSLDETGKLLSFDGVFQDNEGKDARLSSLVWAHFEVKDEPCEPLGGESYPDHA
jgi:hypothetical protein